MRPPPLIATAIRSGFQSNDEKLFSVIASEFFESPLNSRLKFLRTLLQHCHSSDLSFVHSFAFQAPNLQIDFISELPEELAVHVLSFLYLDAPSLKSASAVSRKWHRIIQDNQLWKNLCLKRGWSKEISKYQLYNIPSFAKISAPWKKVFTDNYVSVMIVFLIFFSQFSLI